jgi:RNA polymerase sigma-70 factor (ECF subfamily)
MRSLRLLDDVPAQAASTGGPAAAAPADNADSQRVRAAALALPVQFSFDSADILPGARAQLDALAQGIRLLPALKTVVIEGHTDAVGSDQYNEQLSQRRAFAVKRYLVAEHHIDPSRLRAVGLGKYEPLPGKDPLAAENRACSSEASDAHPAMPAGNLSPSGYEANYHGPTPLSSRQRGGPTMDNDEVLRLLERIGQRDEAAFRELYRGFSRRLYAYVLRQLGEPAQAEEIVADTLYEVWRAPAKFRGDSQFSTWLIGIARNKVLMAFRSRKPDQQHDGPRDVADSIAPTTRAPFELLAQQQRHEGVRHCMDACRTTIANASTWCSTRGLSLAEVASLQACPEGTVKTRLFHARNKLKTCLKLLLQREGGTLAGAAP